MTSRKNDLTGRTLAAGNVVEESGCLYISSVAADGNPISREQHREMGLPSADALKMQKKLALPATDPSLLVPNPKPYYYSNSLSTPHTTRRCGICDCDDNDRPPVCMHMRLNCTITSTIYCTIQSLFTIILEPSYTVHVHPKKVDLTSGQTLHATTFPNIMPIM